MGASCSSLIQNNDWRMLSAEFHEALKKLQNLPPTRVKQGNAVPLADTFTVAGCSSLVQNKHWRMLSAEFHEALKKVPPTEVKQGNAILRHDTKHKTDTKVNTHSDSNYLRLLKSHSFLPPYCRRPPCAPLEKDLCVSIVDTQASASTNVHAVVASLEMGNWSTSPAPKSVSWGYKFVVAV